MNSPSVALRLASILAGLIGLAHLLRVLVGTAVRVGAYSVPLWVSIPAAAIGFVLCGWVWKLGTHSTQPLGKP